MKELAASFSPAHQIETNIFLPSAFRLPISGFRKYQCDKIFYETTNYFMPIIFNSLFFKRWRKYL